VYGKSGRVGVGWIYRTTGIEAEATPPFLTS